jgi:hypothetical protein
VPEEQTTHRNTSLIAEGHAGVEFLAALSYAPHRPRRRDVIADLARSEPLLGRTTTLPPPGTAMAQATLKNQQKILSGHRSIISNQKKILRNQERLLLVLANEIIIIRNQEAIIKNQKKILANQAKLGAR